MEILSLWVEEYMCIDHQSFNLSSEFFFEYRFNKTIEGNEIKSKDIYITIAINHDYYNIYSPSYKNVTGIVGANGAGKTTFTKLLKIMQQKASLAGSPLIIIIYRFEGVIYMDYYRPNSIMPNTYKVKVHIKTQIKNIRNLIKLKSPQPLSFNNLFIRTNLFFYSPVLSRLNEKQLESTSLINCSLDYKLRKAFNVKALSNFIEANKDEEDSLLGDTFDIFKIHFNENNRIFLNFIYFLNKPQNKNLYGTLIKNLNIPSGFHISPGSYLEKAKKSFVFFAKDYEELIKQIIYLYFKNYDLATDYRVSFSYRIRLSFFLGFVFNTKIQRKFDYSEIQSLESFLQSVQVDENIFSEIDKILVKLSNSNIKAISETINIYFEILDRIDLTEIKGDYRVFSKLIYYEVDINLSTLQLVTKIVQLNDLLSIELSTYSFNYFLSSGEEVMLTQYSEIFDAKRFFKYESSLIIFDEGELLLHPEWQRFYVRNILAFIDTLFPKLMTKQVIFTSHSALIASDFPKYNLIFLSRSGSKTFMQSSISFDNTFAANILNILADSFFLTNLIGEYSFEKINQVIKYINDSDTTYFKNDDEALRFINMIGEPIIKEQLIFQLSNRNNQ